MAQRHRRSNRRRTRKTPYSSNNDNNSNGSIIWTLLLLGIVFCLFDVGYMFYAMHHHKEEAAIKPTHGFAASSPQDTQQQHEFVADEAVKPSSNTNNANDIWAGKERILQILKEAKMAHDLTPDVIRQLPTWQQVVDRLGPAPKIHGLDSCSTFTSTIDPAESFIAPAGKFNSGTNLMAELLIANCYNPARRAKYGTAGVRWQVNWGKHQPPKWRLKNGVYEDKSAPPNENILPVVTIRDPYLWMQSMCRNRYATHWFHEVNFHCPNLIPNHVEYEFLPQALDGSYKRDRIELHHKDPWLMDNIMNVANFTIHSKTVPVYVKYKMETTNHESLAHLWNDWYRAYYQADFPRVMVRYEDLLFYGKEVTTAACECMGGKLKTPKNFHHVGVSAKKGSIHQNKTSLVDNIIKFGQRQEADKSKLMTTDDLEFAKATLDKTMMETFGYYHPSSSSNSIN